MHTPRTKLWVAVVGRESRRQLLSPPSLFAMSSDGKSKEMVAYEEQIARDKISIAERLARPNAFSLYDEGAPMGDVLRKLQEIASDEKVGPHMAPTILKGSVYVDGREYTLNEDNNLLVDGAPRSPLPAW